MQHAFGIVLEISSEHLDLFACVLRGRHLERFALRTSAVCVSGPMHVQPRLLAGCASIWHMIVQKRTYAYCTAPHVPH